MIHLTFEGLGALLRGLFIGMLLAIPVGPIALLCMRRTLERGPLYGFVTGLGAAAADMLYGGIAAFGVAALAGFVHQYNIPLRLVGGSLMLVLAARLARKSRGMSEPGRTSTGHKISALLSGFVLTASNPLTMVGFAAFFTGLGYHNAIRQPELAVPLVIGIGIGSALWWFILTIGVVRLRHRLSDKAMHRINLIASSLLAAFGIYAIGSVLQHWFHG